MSFLPHERGTGDFLPQEETVAVTQRDWPEPGSGQCWVRGLGRLFRFHKVATLKAITLNDDTNDDMNDDMNHDMNHDDDMNDDMNDQ